MHVVILLSDASVFVGQIFVALLVSSVRLLISLQRFRFGRHDKPRRRFFGRDKRQSEGGDEKDLVLQDTYARDDSGRGAKLHQLGLRDDVAWLLRSGSRAVHTDTGELERARRGGCESCSRCVRPRLTSCQNPPPGESIINKQRSLITGFQLQQESICSSQGYTRRLCGVDRWQTVQSSDSWRCWPRVNVAGEAMSARPILWVFPLLPTSWTFIHCSLWKEDIFARTSTIVRRAKYR